jgi:hypothetical protein
MLYQRIRLIANKLIALFILKLTYSRIAQMLFGLLGTVFLLLFIINYNFIYILFFILFFGPYVGVLLMKPFDDIIVISRITGSPHVLIKNREVISNCFEGDKLNTILLLITIKNSMYNFLYEYAIHSKRKFIKSYTHKVMFRTLGLEKFNFIKDVKEIKPGIIRDKLIFVSFKEILKRKELKNLITKVPYYKFKVDIKLLKEYIDENPVNKYGQ